MSVESTGVACPSPAPSLAYLPPIDPDDAPGPGGAGPDHPMRKVTREVAFEGEWTGMIRPSGRYLVEPAPEGGRSGG